MTYRTEESPCVGEWSLSVHGHQHCDGEEIGSMLVGCGAEGTGRAGLGDRLVTQSLLSPQGPKDTTSPPNLIAWSDQPPGPYTPLLEDSLSGQSASATA